MMMSRAIVYGVILVLGVPLCLSVGCKTKAELRRQQDMYRLQKELRSARGSRADTEVSVEEMRGELGRLANMMDERAQFQTLQFDTLRKELEALSTRLQALEQHAVSQQIAPPQKTINNDASNVTYATGRKMFEAGKYSQAIVVLKKVIRKTPAGQDKHSRFLLAESYFVSKQYRLAALEFREFMEKYSRDSAVPKAIYRQAQSFKKLKKNKEARLFYKELIDKYPKSSFAKKAKKEIR